MKKIIVSALFVLLSVPAFAAPISILGGKPLATPTAHYVGAGWPSLKYEYWQAGHEGGPDWAVGAELVYGDWSGNFSNVDIGGAFNVPIRWHIHHDERFDVGFQITPGGLAGNIKRPGDDSFVGGVRADVGLPVTFSLNDQVNLITGVTLPLTMLFVQHGDNYGVIPILFRFGAEIEVTPHVTPSLLVELGPTIAVSKNNTSTDLGVRVWAGVSFF